MTSPNLDDVLVLIPARMASTRLPGKPLADICGLPMIVQVALRAKEAEIGRVVVAVDDQQVHDVVAAAGFEVIMTSKDHQSGSDRIYEALMKVDPEGKAKFVVNVQGDLPTIEPDRSRRAAPAGGSERRHRNTDDRDRGRGRQDGTAYRQGRRLADLGKPPEGALLHPHDGTLR